MQSISFVALEKGKKPDYLEENDKHQCFYGDKLIILFTQIKETFVMLGFHLLRTAPTLVNKLTEISSTCQCALSHLKNFCKLFLNNVGPHISYLFYLFGIHYYYSNTVTFYN